mmetsp:Transcript_72157/g.127542  ORF Transcript_72157/g.127542 Transcript_72157/m.127542 type:complete len:293 (-) Transcript_72157:308-1186(-)
MAHCATEEDNRIQMHPKSLHRLAKQEKIDAKQSSWWTLIWCFERCHKAEVCEFRQSLSAKCKDANSTLLCHKKSMRFMEWWETKLETPYSILTDWREVKPILAGLKKIEDPSKYPIEIYILAERDMVYSRASDWVKSVQSEVIPQIKVIRPLDTEDRVQAFVADVSTAIEKKWALHNPKPPPAIQDWSHPSRHDVQAETGNLKEKASTPTCSSARKPLKLVNIKKSNRFTTQASCPEIDMPIHSTASDFDSLPLPSRSLPLFDFLTQAVSQKFAAEQIERLLKDGLPECYED